MNDDVFGAVLVVLIGIAALFGVMSLFVGSWDSTVVAACKKNGYWQTGQTRIICTVEEKK
jgi:hypothetical protein